MFTGIIEEHGVVRSIVKQGTNLVLTIESRIASELKLNESVAHNGACLSVRPISKKSYEVKMCIRDRTYIKCNNV